MWWLDGSKLDRRAVLARAGRTVAGLAVAGLVAGCFQPLYGNKTLDGGPSLNTALAGIDVSQIPAANGTPESRIAVELRNALLFSLSGGNPAPPTHRLDIRMSSSRLSVIVDVETARPDVENYGLTASYTLVDLQTGKPVLTDQSFARVSYDIPGQQQRFARQRALRDAESRAAGVIADLIRSRLASYFVAGT